jgi:CBS domain-containing protein
MTMKVGALCTRGVISVPTSATLVEVATRMRDGHVGAVIVTSGTEPHLRVVGIITDRDIVRAQLSHKADLSRLSAGGTMTERPLVLDEQESLEGAIAQLRARMVRRAPVVAADQRPIGLISIDDLLAQLTTSLIDVVGILGRQARGEPRESIG